MRIREVRDQIGKRVDAAHYGGEATVITSSGERRAVLVPYGWFEQFVNQHTATPTEETR